MDLPILKSYNQDEPSAIAREIHHNEFEKQLSPINRRRREKRIIKKSVIIFMLLIISPWASAQYLGNASG